MDGTDHVFSLRPKGMAVVYLWLLGEAGTVECAGASHATVDIALRRSGTGAPVTSERGRPLVLAVSAEDGDSIWELHVANQADKTGQVRLQCTDAYPFVWPGPGIVPSHFPEGEPALFLNGATQRTLWCCIPEAFGPWSLQAILPCVALPEVIDPQLRHVPLEWRVRDSAYHVAELDPIAGWWALPLAACEEGAYLTVREGLPLFLARPPKPFPYGAMTVQVVHMQEPIAARVRALRGNQLLAQRDVLPGEAATMAVPPGPVTVAVTGGPRLRACAQACTVAAGEQHVLQIGLDAAVQPEPGWYCGDHHMHSYFEDGGQAPEAVVRAARAHGLDYLFLTDADPEGVIAAGLMDFSVPGRFLALPGQEAQHPSLHCNALNIRSSVPAADGDTPEDAGSVPLADWLAHVARQTSQGVPATLMLNHPSHQPEVQARHAYFRSWWAADRHPAIRLVENFDLPSWYERLNRGRRLTGLWTTDTHDVVFIPPGACRTYVYLPDGLNESGLIAALEAGRCFNTRHPGALLYLTVNGAGPGDEATSDGSDDVLWQVKVRCASNRPLRCIDLVSEGAVVRRWSCGTTDRFDAEERLPLTGWVLALAYALEEPPVANNGHYGNPLDVDGCIAFTNPVWLAPP